MVFSQKVKFLSVSVGAQIIDLMMLVVDATKGMQTQTAEVLWVWLVIVAIETFCCSVW